MNLVVEKENGMAGTFTQIYIQAVFAVRGRQNLLKKEWRQESFKYMAGIIKKKKHKPIIVNGVSDHVHVFIGMKPSMALSDLIRDIKNNPSNHINNRGLLNGHFSWQEGYGAFSYSHDHIGNVYNYILNQEKHHEKKTFKEEYFEFLDEYEVPYEERFLFDWLD